MVPSYTHKVYNMEISEVPVGNWMLQDYAAGKYEAEQLVFASGEASFGVYPLWRVKVWYSCGF